MSPPAARHTQDECGPHDARTVSEHAGRDGNCCEGSGYDTFGKTALKSAAILRGGELEPKRHLPPSDGDAATNDARDISATLLFAVRNGVVLYRVGRFGNEDDSSI